MLQNSANAHVFHSIMVDTPVWQQTDLVFASEMRLLSGPKRRYDGPQTRSAERGWTDEIDPKCLKNCTRTTDNQARGVPDDETQCQLDDIAHGYRGG